MFTIDYKKNKEVTLAKPLRKLFKVTTRPNIPMAEEVVIEKTLANGVTYYYHTGVYKNRKINVECNFVILNDEQYDDRLSEIQNAFIGGDGGKLTFSDDTNYYWNVKNVMISEPQRINKKNAEFTITFDVDAFKYSIHDIAPRDIKFNANGYDYTIINNHSDSKPKFRFMNSSNNIKWIKLNDFVINEPFKEGVLYGELDTEECTYIQFFEDGTSEKATLNTEGVFKDLTIVNGLNTIRLTCDVATIQTYIYTRLRRL